MRSVQQVEDDDAFCRLIYRFAANKMMLKYQSGRKHELTNDMMKRAKGEGIVRYSKSEPDDFLRAKYEHMMGVVLTDRPPDSKGLKRKATQDYESSSGSLARAASDMRDMPKISPRSTVFLALVRLRLLFGNFDNKRGAVSSLFLLVGSNG